MPLCAARSTKFHTMDDDDDFRLSVVDVYDIAADIGKEFEKIIDQFGPDVLTSLMPRVITALEQLERVAEKQETSGAVIEELRSTISVLEHQKLGQAEHRQRYARDLEDIERDMREEKQELSARVSELMDENRKLSSCIARTSDDNTPSLTDEENSLEAEVNRDAVTRLQDTVEAQREQIHRTQLQLQRQIMETQQLSSQMECLQVANKDLRRRGRQGSQQIRQLVEERAELHVNLQELQRTLTQQQQRLGLAAKECWDLATAPAPSDPSDLSTKLVYERDDPHRPRFTLTELKDILYQRNELKARLSDLEDELSLYKPKDDSASKKQRGSHIICPPDEANGPPLLNLDRLLLDEDGEPGNIQVPSETLLRQLQDSDASDPSKDDKDEDEPPEDGAPVQGPMPYEPDDAPWKRGAKESGIRKFFERMKKMSDTVLRSGDPVLGTPTGYSSPLGRAYSSRHAHLGSANREPFTSFNSRTHFTPSRTGFGGTNASRRSLSHHHHLHFPNYHSTPNSAFSTPTPSMNVSSPPSLRSLPPDLEINNVVTDGILPGGSTTTSCSTSGYVHDSESDGSSFNTSDHQVSSTGRSGRSWSVGSPLHEGGTATIQPTSDLSSVSFVSNTSRDRSASTVVGNSNTGPGFSSSKNNGNNTTSGFSFEKFRSRFGIPSSSESSSSNRPWSARFNSSGNSSSSRPAPTAPSNNDPKTSKKDGDNSGDRSTSSARPNTIPIPSLML